MISINYSMHCHGIHGPQKMNLNDFSDTHTFPVAPPSFSSDICGCEWNIWTTIRWIAVKFSTFMFLWGQNLMTSNDPLTFPPVPPSGQCFSEIAWHLLDGLDLYSYPWFPNDVFSLLWWSLDFSCSAAMWLTFVVQEEMSRQLKNRWQWNLIHTVMLLLILVMP